MLKKILFIIFTIFILYFIVKYILDEYILDNYSNYIANQNYVNNLYLVRPPSHLAHLYYPFKLGAVRILKSKFLNFPIRG